MDAVATLWRSQLRRRWHTWLVLALLLALGAGAGLAGLAGARRTASTFDRHAEASGFPDVNTGHARPPAEAERTIAGFEGVASHSTVVGFVGAVDELEPALVKYYIGPWEAPIARIIPTLRTGRYPRPDATDEVMVVGRDLEDIGIEPGDELTIRLFTSDFSDVVSKHVVVVGVGDDPLAAVADATYDRTAIYFTPAFTRENAADLQAWSASEFIAEPGEQAIDRLITQLGDVGWSIDETRPVSQARVQDAIRPLVTVLALLGALILATTLLVVGQALVRQSESARTERQAILAMGCTHRQVRAVDALSALTVAVPGGLGAVAVAIAASPLFPTGAVRQLDPTRGVAIDATVHAAGGLGVVVLLVLLGTFGRRRLHLARTDRVARPLLAGLASVRPSTTPGLRLAVGGTRRERSRFWTTVALSSAGLGLLVGGLAFVAALDDLADEPSRYGAGWDLTTRNAFGDVPPDEVRSLLDGDPDIEGVAAGTLGSVVADDVSNVPVMAFLPITAELWPTVSEGRVPRGRNEVLVGADVLDRLDAQVGDRIGLSSPYDPEGTPTEVEIVGRAVFPSIELAGQDPARLGQGIALGWDDYRTIVGGFSNVPDQAPDMVFFDLADGVDAHDVIERYPEGMPEATGFAPTEWLTSLAPAEVLETDRATGLIWAVIGLLGVLVLASLAHSLIGRVREHRRDYAILKAIGFTRADVMGAVAWQSMVPILLALLLALPLGTVVGRWWWRTLAHLIGVIDTPVLPVLSLLGVTATALVAAGLLAVQPGLRVARTPAAEALQQD